MLTPCLIQGAICLDTLGTGWSPVGTIKTALISLRMLLESPNPRDPQDAEVAKMMLDNPALFAQKAHEWAVKHAGAPPRELSFNNMVAQAKAAEKKDDPKRCVDHQARESVFSQREKKLTITAGTWGIQRP